MKMELTKLFLLLQKPQKRLSKPSNEIFRHFLGEKNPTDFRIFLFCREIITEEQLCHGWDTVSAEAAAVANTDKASVNNIVDFSQLPLEEKDGEKVISFAFACVTLNA